MIKLVALQLMKSVMMIRRKLRMMSVLEGQMFAL